MRIAGRQIGGESPVYLIAEIGVNHDGDTGRALELIDAAARAGADAVKLQFFETDRLMSSEAKLAAYQRRSGERDPISMLRRLELRADELALCVRRAHELGVHAIVSVFSVELVRDAVDAGFDALKSASPDITNRPLLREMERSGLPMIVSTGASSTSEVARARRWLIGAEGRVAYLHCVSAYPTPIDEANIAACGALADIVSPCPVGYSDHTSAIDAGAAAASVHASILEKHLTWDRDAAGPDHSSSFGPDTFRVYVQKTRAHPVSFDRRLLGDGSKRAIEREGDVKVASRQSVVTTRSVRAGETITRGMVTLKRPGTGIPAFELDSVIGARAVMDIPADVPLPCEALALRVGSAAT